MQKYKTVDAVEKAGRTRWNGMEHRVSLSIRFVRVYPSSSTPCHGVVIGSFPSQTAGAIDLGIFELGRSPNRRRFPPPRCYLFREDERTGAIMQWIGYGNERAAKNGN